MCPSIGQLQRDSPLRQAPCTTSCSMPANRSRTPSPMTRSEGSSAKAAAANRNAPNGHATNGHATEGRPCRRVDAGSSKAEQAAQLVAGKEVVGRRIAVWWQRQQEWMKGAVKEFEISTGKHRVVYTEKTHKKDEEWLVLSASRFQWLDPPKQGQASNPTFAALPEKADMVNARVRVYWPAMGRWYLGTVKGYDGRTRKHKIAYKDGDLKHVTLRHEAVLLMDADASSSPAAEKPSGVNRTGRRVDSSSKADISSRQQPALPRHRAIDSGPVAATPRAARRNSNVAAAEASSSEAKQQQPPGDSSPGGSLATRSSERQQRPGRSVSRRSRAERWEDVGSPPGVQHIGEVCGKVRAASARRRSVRSRRQRDSSPDSGGESDDVSRGSPAAVPMPEQQQQQQQQQSSPANGKRRRGGSETDKALGSPPKLARVDDGPEAVINSPSCPADSDSSKSPAKQNGKLAADVSLHARQRRMASISPEGATPLPMPPSPTSVVQAVCSISTGSDSGAFVPPLPSDAKFGPGRMRSVSSIPAMLTAPAPADVAIPAVPALAQQAAGAAADGAGVAGSAPASMLLGGAASPPIVSTATGSSVAAPQPQPQTPESPVPSSPVTTLGFSPQATTLQAALSLPMTTCAATQLQHAALPVTAPVLPTFAAAAMPAAAAASASAAAAAMTSMTAPLLPATLPATSAAAAGLPTLQLQSLLSGAIRGYRPEEDPLAMAATLLQQSRPPSAQARQPVLLPMSMPAGPPPNAAAFAAASLPPLQPRSPIRVRIPLPQPQQQAAVGTSPALPAPLPVDPRRSKQLEAAAEAKHGSETPSGLRPLRAARLASAVAGGPARGDGALTGARVAVYWHEDEEYYKGTLAALDGYHKRAKVCYDDGEEEWLALPRHAFRWLAPRARSAGCTEPLKRALAALGAQGIMPEPLTPPPLTVGVVPPLATPIAAAAPPTDATAAAASAAGVALPAAVMPEADEATAAAAPTGPAAVGQRVSVWCHADSLFYRGEVLAYDRHRGQHQILYEDGEDESVRLAQETLRWHGPAPAGPCAAGLPAGKQVPKGRAAVGWRIGVYWREDRTFYTGDVESYNASSGRHTVLYDDGEEEDLQLGVEKVKWLVPPEVGPSEEARRRAPRRRRRDYDSSDSDEDWVAETPRPASRATRVPSFGDSGRTSTGGVVTRLPPPMEPVQAPPGREPLCVRSLPSVACLGSVPIHRSSSAGGSLTAGSLGSPATFVSPAFATPLHSMSVGSATFSRLSAVSGGSATPAAGSCKPGGPVRVAIYGPARANETSIAAAATSMPATGAASPRVTEPTATVDSGTAAASVQQPEAQLAAAAARLDVAVPVAGAATAPIEAPAILQPELVETATAAPPAGESPAGMLLADASAVAAAAVSDAAPPAANQSSTPAASAAVNAEQVQALQQQQMRLEAMLARCKDGERRLASRSRALAGSRRLLGGKLPVPESLCAGGGPSLAAAVRRDAGSHAFAAPNAAATADAALLTPQPPPRLGPAVGAPPPAAMLASAPPRLALPVLRAPAAATSAALPPAVHAGMPVAVPSAVVAAAHAPAPNPAAAAAPADIQQQAILAHQNVASTAAGAAPCGVQPSAAADARPQEEQQQQQQQRPSQALRTDRSVPDMAALSPDVSSPGLRGCDGDDVDAASGKRQSASALVLNEPSAPQQPPRTCKAPDRNGMPKNMQQPHSNVLSNGDTCASGKQSLQDCRSAAEDSSRPRDDAFLQVAH